MNLKFIAFFTITLVISIEQAQASAVARKRNPFEAISTTLSLSTPYLKNCSGRISNYVNVEIVIPHNVIYKKFEKISLSLRCTTRRVLYRNDKVFILHLTSPPSSC